MASNDGIVNYIVVAMICYDFQNAKYDITHANPGLSNPAKLDKISKFCGSLFLGLQRVCLIGGG